MIMLTPIQEKQILSQYEDLITGFFLYLRDTCHFHLSADRLCACLAASKQADLTSEEEVMINMQMFFCSDAEEFCHFPDYFHTYYYGERASLVRKIRSLSQKLDSLEKNSSGPSSADSGEEADQKQQSTRPQTANTFFQISPGEALHSDRLAMTLPSYEAERAFSAYEEKAGKVLYSGYLHAAFLNHYEDFLDHYHSLAEFAQNQMTQDLVRTLRRFDSYARKHLDGPERICAKTRELASFFSREGVRESDDDPGEMSEEELKRRLEEAKLLYAAAPLHKLTKASDLAHKDLRLLTKRDLEIITEDIKKNANKFRARMKRRLSTSGQTLFDMPRTTREAFRTAMTPVRLYFKAPPQKQVNLVCLLDISPSCLTGATLLIHFLYQLVSLFHGRVKVFFFTDRARDVTEDLTSRTIPAIIKQAALDSSHTVSRYSEVFDGFFSNYGHVLRPGTQMMILGDMRNNYLPYAKKPLEQIADKIHQSRGRLWLLNPRPRKSWYSDDSLMAKTEQVFDGCFPVTCLAELSDFLEGMTL